MATYQIAWKLSTMTATVQRKGDALPSGAVKLTEFDHELNGVEDSDDRLGIHENHVFFHHVQEAIRQIDIYDPKYQNMQAITIVNDTDYIAVTGFSFLPATVTLAPAATQALTPTFVPVSPSNTKVTYVSSNPAKATVNATTGLITAVADGSATITGTTEDGGFTDTCVVTVQT